MKRKSPNTPAITAAAYVHHLKGTLALAHNPELVREFLVAVTRLRPEQREEAASFVEQILEVAEEFGDQYALDLVDQMIARAKVRSGD